MRGSRIAFLVALAVLAAAGGAARAQSRYERLKVTALKKAGKVIGARVKLVLRPDTGWNPGADRVRIGLGSMDKAKAGTDHRAAASDKKKGYLLHQFPQLDGVTQVKEITLEVLYGKGNKLKGGEKVDVVSAWNAPKGSNPKYWHVYGMFTSQQDKSSVITLPKAAKPTR